MSTHIVQEDGSLILLEDESGSLLLELDAVDNVKLAHMEWCNMFEPALPVEPSDPFTQGEQQQLLWGFPGVLWEEVTGVAKRFVIRHFFRSWFG